MMQITRAEIIAVTLLIHQSLTVPPASLNFAIRLSALCSNSHNQRPAVKPRYCCNGRCLTDITTINLFKVKRHTLLNLLQCHSVLTFRREVFQAKLLAVTSTNGKEAGSVRRLLIWVLGLAWQVCEGDQIVQWLSSTFYNVTLDFWFSSVRYQFPPTTPAYRTPALIIDTIFINLAAKRLISEPIESVPM